MRTPPVSMRDANERTKSICRSALLTHLRATHTKRHQILNEKNKRTRLRQQTNTHTHTQTHTHTHLHTDINASLSRHSHDPHLQMSAQTSEDIHETVSSSHHIIVIVINVSGKQPAYLCDVLWCVCVLVGVCLCVLRIMPACIAQTSHG